MLTPEQTVLAYFRAWLTPDEHTREALLKCSWAADGIYTDPSNMAHGRQELLALIAQFQVRWSDARMMLTSGVDSHHDRLRFSWVLVRRDGAPIEGFDIGELDRGGRLRRITGFFGPFPPIPESWPEGLIDRPRGTIATQQVQLPTA